MIFCQNVYGYRLTAQSLPVYMYIMSAVCAPYRMFTLYAKSLPFDVASRVWDVFCRDGEEFLFRTALGMQSMSPAVNCDLFLKSLREMGN